MDFLDELGKKASKTYKKTAEKTAKMAKISKIKAFMNENKDKIDEIYQEMGKKIYEKHIREDNMDITQELQEQCHKIDILSDEIEDFRVEYLRLKDKKQCKNCFYEIEVNAHYCSNCGMNQCEDKKQTEEQYKVEQENDEQIQEKE